MRFFDFHCDTLYRAIEENKSIYQNNFHNDINRSKRYKPYIGCFAVWIPDDVRGIEALKLFNRAVEKVNMETDLHKNYVKICRNSEDLKYVHNEVNAKQGIILTVEGGAVLGGKSENLKYLIDSGVKIMTLTWNGKCEIGDGVGVANSKGLTNFGCEIIKEMESNNIIVDISHASERLFYDVAQIAKKPFIATHSNARKICDNNRNLNDEQFIIIKNCGGLVGITFCKQFLSECENANFDDVRRHIEHFLELNGEDVLSIGSDFDGADVPDDICGIEYLENLYEYFLIKNYSEKLLDKIFFNNAYNFMINHMS